MTIRQVGDVLEVKTPYSASLVARLKSLPLEDRAWDRVDRVWRVHARHLQFVQDACREAGFDVSPLVAVQSQSKPIQRVLRIEYVGAPEVGSAVRIVETKTPPKAGEGRWRIDEISS